MSETTQRALRLALASLLAVALGARFAIAMSRPGAGPVDVFSYFSVVCSLLAVIMLTMLARRPEQSSSRWFSLFRGAVTLYMSLALASYAIALARTGEAPLAGEPWVDWVIYLVGPLALVLDWSFEAPGVDLPQSAAAIWLALPAAYLGFILARGAVVGRYPYPFLDPGEVGGYVGVGISVGAALTLTLVLGYGYFRWAGRRLPEPVTA